MPAAGAFPMAFSLWDAPTAGNQIGPTILLEGVQVADGLFTARLDFGAGAFGAEARWLEIIVSGQTLSPRQEMTAAPASMYAAAPWITIGTDLSFAGGRVGIGTTQPSTALEDHQGRTP